MRDSAWWACGFTASITPCPGMAQSGTSIWLGSLLYLELVTCELCFLCTCVWFDQHGVFENWKHTFQKVGRFFTAPDFQLKTLRGLGLISSMARITWSWTAAASFRSATLSFLGLSQSSLLSLATQQGAGMSGNRQPGDFPPEWVRPPVHVRGLWAERAARKPGSLSPHCYWPAWGHWTSYATSLTPVTNLQ